jgi:hypothetical protein
MNSCLLYYSRHGITAMYPGVLSPKFEERRNTPVVLDDGHGIWLNHGSLHKYVCVDRTHRSRIWCLAQNQTLQLVPAKQQCYKQCHNKSCEIPESTKAFTA